MQNIRVNIEYRRAPSSRWEDSERRAEHAVDRLQQRGVGIHNIKEAVQYGAKTIRADGSIIAKYRWYSVVYREFILPEFKKIYPITVLLDNN